MKTEELKKVLEANFGGDLTEIVQTSPKRLLVRIKKGLLLEIANFFFEELRFRFVIETAISRRECFEILYHFSDDSTGNMVNLGVELPRDKAEIDSLANMISAANWIEREINDLFGIQFRNHTGGGQLIAQGNWPPGKHPYAESNR